MKSVFDKAMLCLGQLSIQAEGGVNRDRRYKESVHFLIMEVWKGENSGDQSHEKRGHYIESWS